MLQRIPLILQIFSGIPYRKSIHHGKSNPAADGGIFRIRHLI